ARRVLGLLRSARNDSVECNLAPLAGRGRRRREAKSPGEGDYPRVCRESPSPARKMLATSPRKRGEVKSARRASNGLLRSARNVGQNQFDRGCLKSEVSAKSCAHVGCEAVIHWAFILGRHTRESGYPVRRGFPVYCYCAGILDHPLSRMMTVVWARRRSP